MLILFVFITLLYFVFALFGIYLIWSDKHIKTTVPVPIAVSVIVALRNEENNVNRLVKGLTCQKYPLQLEFIFVDDNSSDKTLKLLNEWSLKDKRIKVISNDGDGKKECISKAIKCTSNPIIVQTDADCEMGQYWIISSVNKLLSSKQDLVLGPVYPFQSKTLLNGLIRIEWLAMQFMTILTSRLKNPGMANGANLTFYKKDYEAFSASQYGESYASGDDMFFMRFLQKKGGKVSFNLDQEAIVRTEMPACLNGLLQQRVRWATKAGKTTNTITYFFTLIVFLVNFSWIAAVLSFSENLNYFFVFFKLAVDFLICWNMAIFYNDFKVLRLLPIMFFLYPIYLLMGVVFSFKRSYKWKERWLE